MLFEIQNIPYQQTNCFSKIVLDYIAQNPALQSFYAFPPATDGFKQAIEKKQQQKIDREALVNVLEEQYKSVEINSLVKENIQSLLLQNTFTICTAHQPNLFTGPLYFIYKILHAIKLAEHLKTQFADLHFVPVYYMGSEDADLDELNHTYVQGKKYEWQTKQTGAVGRMIIDKQLVALIDELEGQLTTAPFGQEVIALLRACYQPGRNIQTATFELVNALFGRYGLIVLIPDNAVLKRSMISIFEDDIFQQNPSQIVELTCQRLSQQYNVQANPREINLFYLKDNIRERIVKNNHTYFVHNTDIHFTADEIKAELQQHPERFSPNVILRGLFQETILPNIAFIGGGGEIAYWLQLKDLFDHYTVPYPILVLRNSFLIIEKRWQSYTQKLQLSAEQLFQTDIEIINAYLQREGRKPQLNGELDKLKSIYEELKQVASSVDITLNQHVEALKVKALSQLINLEQKMLRAERKKHDVVRNQIATVKQQLFPKNNLQERVENFSSFYAKWGSIFIDDLYNSSLSLEQQFAVLFEG